MKQVIVKKGNILAKNVPMPVVEEKEIMIKTMYSAISAGTEMSGIKESKKSLIKKALEQPEKVKIVLQMIRDEGIERVYGKIKGKIGIGNATGYSVAGVVVGVGRGVTQFTVGDYVAAAGSGYANHAEFVSVPENLVIKMPNNASFRESATVTLGGISMQGVRRADLRIGEFCVVMGLGILGQITVQILKNAGIRVIGIDIDDRRVQIGIENGVEKGINALKTDPVKEVLHYTNGYGADAVIFTAATSSNIPLSQSFQMTRKKGKVVLVGVSGMEIKREDIYPKEIDFLISTSYGPGRYDENYEKKGLDYPYAYVRWTENRNMQEYLRLLGEKKINLSNIIEKEYKIEDVEQAYKEFEKEEKPLIVLLKYDEKIPNNIEEYIKQKIENRNIFINKTIKTDKKKVNLAVIGAGGFVSGVHLPNLRKMKDKYNIYAIVGKNSATTAETAEYWGAQIASTDYNSILQDNDIDAVLIGTRHNLHAQMVLDALNAGKHVFVEKPLCLKMEELEKIESFFKNKEETPVLMVGFNRRFSPLNEKIKGITEKRINPLFIRYRMNAGYIPANHWVHTEEGGGRIKGEACHIIDLFNFFTNAKAIELSVNAITPKTNSVFSEDNRTITVKYEDGSVCSLDYVSIGSREYPKEFMEIHFDEKTIIMDNYKSVQFFGIKERNLSLSVMDKGHYKEMELFYESIKTGKGSPIPLWDIFQTTQLSILSAEI